MPISILMPALSPTMKEGKLAKWTKKEGDKIKPGEVIAEIETDKATMEVEAVDAGKLGKILVPAGTENVPVNKMIGVLLEDGEDAGSIDTFLSNDNKKAAAPVSAATASPQTHASASVPMMQAQQSSVSSGARVFATPLARRIARDKGINLSNLRGSGPHGRIVRADVENAKPGQASGGGSAMRTASGPNARQLADLLGMSYEAQPVSGMRKTIAARLSESKQTVPHFYLTTDCRIDALMAARAALNEQANGKYKLSVNDFVIKAVAAALMKVPAANMSWSDNEVIQYKNADISVAVATPSGLITPIIKEAQNKSLPAISTEMKDLAARARDGKLKPVEYQGGTFSISNLGMYGVKDFAAIINPPQACILAVGAGVEQPVVQNGQIVIGTVMSVTLSVDHRVVDGAVGAEYLKAFKDFIENPILMLV